MRTPLHNMCPTQFAAWQLTRLPEISTISTKSTRTKHRPTPNHPSIISQSVLARHPLTSESAVAAQPTTPSAAPPLQPIVLFKPTTLGHWYMKCKGCLRLGKILSPSRILLDCALSLGLANGFYVSLMFKELNWHRLSHDLHQPTKSMNWLKKLLASSGLSMIPLVSGINFVILAQRIQQLQHNVGLKPCSTHIAFWSSLLPPLGVVYLECQLNNYWKFCVQAYAMIQTQQSSQAVESQSSGGEQNDTHPARYVGAHAA